MCPGFEAMFAIAGLIAIAYLVLRRRPELPTAILAVVMIASVFTAVSATGSAAVVSYGAIAGVVITAIIVIAGVMMWIAGNTKKSPTWINSISDLIMIAFVLTNARYNLTKDEIRTSPWNLMKCNGSPRNY